MTDPHHLLASLTQNQHNTVSPNPSGVATPIGSVIDTKTKLKEQLLLLQEEAVEVASGETNAATVKKLKNIREAVEEIVSILNTMDTIKGPAATITVNEVQDTAVKPGYKTKLPDVREFDGNSAQVDTFLAKLVYFFKVQPERYATQELKVAYAVHRFVGPALSWAESLLVDPRYDYLLEDFEAFCHAVQDKFGDSLSKIKSDIDLFSLSHKYGTLRDHINKFEILWSRAEMPDSQKVKFLLNSVSDVAREQLLLFAGDHPEFLDQYESVKRKLLWSESVKNHVKINDKLNVRFDKKENTTGQAYTLSSFRSSNTKSKLVVEISINTHPITCLFDTGAEGQAFMSASMAKRLDLTVESCEPILLRQYQGKPVEIIEQRTEDTRVQINGVSRKISFFVVNSLLSDVIIGYEWLKQQRVRIDCAQSLIIFPETWKAYLASILDDMPLGDTLTSESCSTSDKENSQDITERSLRVETSPKKRAGASRFGGGDISHELPPNPASIPLPRLKNRTSCSTTKQFQRTPSTQIDSHEFVSLPQKPQETLEDLIRKIDVLQAEILRVNRKPKRAGASRTGEGVMTEMNLPQKPASIPLLKNQKSKESDTQRDSIQDELPSIQVSVVSRERFKIENKFENLVSQKAWVSLKKTEDRDKATGLATVSISSIDTSPVLPEYLSEFKSVFDESKLANLPAYNEKFAMPIDFVEENSELPRAYPYKLSLKEEQALKEEIEKGLLSGQLTFSQAAGGCPVLFVRKPDGSLRMCVDYRKINELTKPIQAILPNIEDIIASLPRSRRGRRGRYSKVDLKGAFNQLRVRIGDEDKTTFITKFGKYKWKVIPFGLMNAPGHFQSVMYQLFSSLLGKGVWVYLDDILIYESDPVKHRALLLQVLQILKDNDLVASLKKCEFEVPEVDFLGYRLGDGIITMQDDKVKAVTKYPPPQTVKGLQRFLGMCNYYRQFIPSYSKIAAPLFNLLQKGMVFSWSETANAAFEKLKASFTDNSFLALPDRSQPFILYTDSSDFAVGAALHQTVDGIERPIAFFSRSLTKPERNYPIYDKELLAVREALAHWRHLLVATEHPVLVHTDHKNLTYFKSPQLLNARQTRWLEFFADYNIQFHYLPGEENVVADALSRPDITEPETEADPGKTLLPDSMWINSIGIETHNYYTPASVVTLAKEASNVQEFDLDPASCTLANDTTHIASSIFTEEDNGLEQAWYGTVFVNPPYSLVEGKHQASRWIQKALNEYKLGQVKTVTLLLRDASGSKYFDDLLKPFTICYLKDRLKFWSDTHKGSSYARDKHVLVFLGPDEEQFVSVMKPHGFIRLPLVTLEYNSSLSLAPINLQTLPLDDLFSLEFLRASEESTTPVELEVLENFELINRQNWPAFIPQCLAGQPVPESLPTMYRNLITRTLATFVRKGNWLYRKVNIQNRDYLAVYVPVDQRPLLIKRIHQAFGHLSASSVLDSVKCRYWWPRMTSDFREYSQSCAICQQTAVQQPSVISPSAIEPVVMPFTRWGIDFVQDLRITDQGNQHIITAMDYTTRYTVAEAVPDRTAKTAAKFLFRLMLRFGAPEEIITDRANVFTGDLLLEFLAIHDTVGLPSTPYHPNTNGLVERMHRVLGDLITKMSEGSPSRWDEFVPSAVFLLNARSHSVTGFSPFQLVYGFQPRLPGDIFPPCIFDTNNPEDVSLFTLSELNRLGQNRLLSLSRSREQQEEYLRSRQGQTARIFEVGEYVKLKNFTRSKFEYRSIGPYIVDRVGPNNVYYLMDARTGASHSNPINGVHLAPWSALAPDPEISVAGPATSSQHTDNNGSNPSPPVDTTAQSSSSFRGGDPVGTTPN